MRNYNTYLRGMEQGNSEKLFFLELLDLNNFDRIIDFGCGKADILKACKNSRAKLIGIDIDPIMLQYARENFPTATYYSTLTKEMITPKTLIIFSSVLHELDDYWNILKEIIKNTGATLVIRDMRFSAKEENISNENLSKIVRFSHPKLLADFIKRWGMKTDKDLYHWFLKYSYVDNWNLELKENYFGFNFEELLTLGEVIYERNYILSFKQCKVIKDFDILIKKPTHTQLIIKLYKKEG